MPRAFLLQINEDPCALLGTDRATASFQLKELLLDQLARVPDGEPVTVTVRAETVTAEELETRQDW